MEMKNKGFIWILCEPEGIVVQEGGVFGKVFVQLGILDSC